MEANQLTVADVACGRFAVCLRDREAAARGRRARQRMVELYSPEALGRQLGKEFDRLKALLRCALIKLLLC